MVINTLTTTLITLSSSSICQMPYKARSYGMPMSIRSQSPQWPKGNASVGNSNKKTIREITSVKGNLSDCYLRMVSA